MKGGLKTIFRKELARFFRDKRMVVTTILLPGLMIYVLYSFMGSAMKDMFSVDEEYVPSICTVNLPDTVGSLGQADGLVFTEISAGAAADSKMQIASRDVDCLLIFPENFETLVSTYDAASGTAAPNIELYFNSADTESGSAYSILMALLDTYESAMANKFDVNAGSAAYDLASEKDASGQIFSSLLPMLLMIFLFSGCMSVAPESIAGEKERGTIATLLITPLRRRDLALGKVLSLSVIALLSAASSFIGTFLSLPKLMGAASDELNANFYTLSDYLLLVLVIFSTVLLFVGLISILSAYAKTVKEATAYVTPLMIVAMLVGVTAMFGSGAQTELPFYLIPMYNSVQCMNAIFSFSASAANITAAVVSNLIYTLICILALTGMFNSEKVLFKK